MYKQLTITLILLLSVVSCSLTADIIPDEFYGLKLVKKLTGEDARRFINRLHGDSVTDAENEIGFYKGDEGEAIIYVTKYKTNEDAERYFKQMTDKISEGNPVFIKPEHIKINGYDVFRCYGMGQSHFVFTYKNKLFWLTVDTEIGMDFTTEYLTYIGCI